MKAYGVINAQDAFNYLFHGWISEREKTGKPPDRIKKNLKNSLVTISLK